MAYKTDYVTKGDQLRLDMIYLKAEFRKKGYIQYMNQYMLQFPEYNTPEGRNKVKNVWNLALADSKIIENFKKLLKQL